ncbi:MAG: alpha/beta hydrolase [Deltaproteobacteria bacterium]|nr:alpha/beta hydrolase [Deltaproteobacteria bacterium]
MKTTTPCALLSGCLALGLACGDGAQGGPADASPDAGAPDAAASDAQPADGGVPDAAEPPPESFERIEIAAGGLVFDARAAGPEDGELVLLLHGFPETSFEWRDQLGALGDAGYRAVAPDQRGYSPRARPTDDDAYEISLLVDDVLAIADALGGARFHVVGHDWGAAVAWGVAKLGEDRVRSLSAFSVPHPDAFRQVLADPTSCQNEASSYFDMFVMPDYADVLLRGDAFGLRFVYAGLPDEAVDEYLSVLGTREALSAALAWYRANVADRMLRGGELGNITVPTLFVWSDGDTALCRDGADLTADFVQGPYRFEVIEGVSHWIPELAPDESTALLLEHLAAAP